MTGIFWADQSGNPPEGVFAFTDDFQGRNHTDDAGAHRISFNASRASVIYRDITTVQVDSGYALTIIKE